MEDGGGGGGGVHSTLQSHSLGISPSPHPPQISSFVWDWEEPQVLILHDQTTGDLKSHHLQAWVTLTALSVPQGSPFLSAELCVICYRK